MVTKVLKAIAGVVVVAAAAMLMPAEASASTQAVAAAPDCQFGNSYGVLVDYGKVTTVSGTVVSVGEVQLCRDSNYNYWGFLLLNSSPSASEYGDVVLLRMRDGLQSSVDCDSTGGNGVVLPGQTRCWTPKLTGLSGAYTFRAEGTMTSSHSGAELAFGYTAETR